MKKRILSVFLTFVVLIFSVNLSIYADEMTAKLYLETLISESTEPYSGEIYKDEIFELVISIGELTDKMNEFSINLHYDTTALELKPYEKTDFDSTKYITALKDSNRNSVAIINSKNYKTTTVFKSSYDADNGNVYFVLSSTNYDKPDDHMEKKEYLKLRFKVKGVLPDNTELFSFITGMTVLPLGYEICGGSTGGGENFVVTPEWVRATPALASKAGKFIDNDGAEDEDYSDDTFASWETYSGCKYDIYLSKDGGAYTLVASDVTSSPKDLASNMTETGRYKFKVKAKRGDVTSDFSGESNEYLKKEKLEKPDNLAVDEKVVTWDNVEHSTSYNVVINDTDKGIKVGNTIVVSEESLDLTAYITSVGHYSIEVTAKSDNELYLDSVAGSVTYNETKQLDKPEASVDNYGVISWSAIEHATNYQIVIKDSNGVPVETPIETTELSVNLETEISVAGAYTIEVTAKSTNDLYPDSEVETKSFDKNVQLGKPEPKVNGGKIAWEPVENAEQYKVTVYSVDDQLQETPVGTEVTVDTTEFDMRANVDGKGTYKVYVQAVSSDTHYPASVKASVSYETAGAVNGYVGIYTNGHKLFYTNFKVSLENEDGEVLYSTVADESTGAFSIEGISEGTYTLVVSKPGCITRKIDGLVLDGVKEVTLSTSDEPIKIYPCDFVADDTNSVAGSDLSRMLAYQSFTIATFKGEETLYDDVKDVILNVKDFNIVNIVETGVTGSDGKDDVTDLERSLTLDYYGKSKDDYDNASIKESWKKN